MSQTFTSSRTPQYAPPAPPPGRSAPEAPQHAAPSRWEAVRLLHAARRVARTTGKGVARQFVEMAALRFGEGAITPRQYYRYHLYDDARYPWAMKREFVNWRVSYLGRRVNDSEWRVLAHDKVAFCTFMRGAGLPHPEVRALFHPGGRHAGPAPCTTTPGATTEFLRSTRYPLFGKPVYGQLGGGAVLLEGYDPVTDLLHLSAGRTEPVTAFVARIQAEYAPRGAGLGARCGYLFQSVLAPDPDVVTLAGDRVTTLRLVVLVHDEGPRLFRCLWRLPVRPNVADNFDWGRSGNLLAAVDRERGVVTRAVRGWATPDAGSELRGIGESVTAHPDTGRELVGVRVPGWDRAVSLALAAARAIPRIRYQSWDIALCAGGPVAVELNFNGHLVQPEQARGFHDAEMRAFLARYGRR